MNEYNQTIGILSYNIHKGFSLSNKKFVLRTMRDAIRALDTDLVFLQEVIGAHTTHERRIKEWPTTPQFEFLADSIWDHHVYGKNAIYSEGHHGNAILSKYPITEWSNHNISTNKYESRGLLHAVIAYGKEKIRLHCICVHLGLTGRGRTIQLARICNRISQHVPPHEPLILAGDFNDWALSASRVITKTIGATEAFKQLKGKHAATFPIVFPMLRLDRIYCRGLIAVDAEVLRGKEWKKLSDHAPVMARLGLRKL